MNSRDQMVRVLENEMFQLMDLHNKLVTKSLRRKLTDLEECMLIEIECDLEEVSHQVTSIHYEEDWT